MAYNDVVLLDSLIEKSAQRFGQNRDAGELFELFVLEQLLKDYDLTYDELEHGWVDGGDDGGIDGLYVFLNDRPLVDDLPTSQVGRSPRLDLWIVTAKHGETFRQTPLNSLLSSLPELFDLRRTESDLQYPFEQAILDSRETFRSTYLKLAGSRPVLTVRVIYASRGDTDHVAPNVQSRAVQLRAALQNLFSNSDIAVDFLGAAELLNAARRQRAHSLSLRFIENTISRGKANYVLLCRLTDFFAFVTDEQVRLRRYLFESDVRDYLTKTPVNKDILSTLGGLGNNETADFWWLNNGVTLLASFATIAGKEISLENVQIVNGLQTTECVYGYLKNIADRSDDRAILVKIIVTEDEEVRDRIIKATNYQNPVALASLRATDRIQRDIEHSLGDRGWYYDRRNNFYKNQGIPAERIVSMSYLAACVRAIALREPQQAQRQRTKFMRDDRQYARVFNTEWKLDVFGVCLQMVKAVETEMRAMHAPEDIRIRSHGRDLRFLVAFLVICKRLGRTKFAPEDVVGLGGRVPEGREVQEICQVIQRTSREESGGKFKSVEKAARSAKFVGAVWDRLAGEKVAGTFSAGST